MQKTSMLETANFRVPWPDWPHPFLTMPTPKNFDQLLIFVNLYQHAKNQFISSIHPSNTVKFRALPHDWPHPFFIKPVLKILNHLLICMNLYQHAKNQLIPSVHFWHTVNLESWDQICSICSGEIVHLKIM